MANIQLTENLSALRKAYGFTQKDISDKLNISRQAYSNYERNERTPDLDLLIKLSQIYQVSLDQLVNSSCAPNGLLKEQKGPYTPGLEIDSANTLYLTSEEVKVIKKYRLLTKDYKKIIDKFLDI